jgi:ketosteroid isomerase-like protein
MNLQRLFDQMLITELETAYASAVAAQDPDALAELFTEDAVLDYYTSAEPVRGRAAIREFFAATLPRTAPRPVLPFEEFAFSTPLVANLTVVIDGDRAVADSLGLPAHAGNVAGAGEVLLRLVSNHDELRRTTEGWLIYRRRHAKLWSVRLAADAPFEVGPSATR